MARSIEIYDTTLRDGSQGQGIHFSVDDKLRIAAELERFGMAYIEGGWPGSNPRDVEFFARAKKLKFKNAKLAAFGSTRRKGVRASEDAQVRGLLEVDTPVVTIYGKTSALHVREVLRCSPEENLEMIRDTVAFLKSHRREVVYDCEHAIDGWKEDPAYAIASMLAAVEGGADRVVLCDTNGGSLPSEVAAATRAAIAALKKTAVGIHTHDDAGLGLATDTPIPLAVCAPPSSACLAPTVAPLAVLAGVRLAEGVSFAYASSAAGDDWGYHARSRAGTAPSGPVAARQGRRAPQTPAGF